MFVAEGGMRTGEEDAPLATRYCTCVVDFTKDAPQVLASLSGTLHSVLEHSFSAPLQLAPERLAAMLSAVPPAWTLLLVRLPDRQELAQGMNAADSRALEAVDDVLRALSSDSAHNVIVSAAVSASPSEWAGLRMVSQFVQVEPQRAQRDFCALFKAAASFMAPCAVLEFDDVDLLEAFGSAQQPARIAHLTWSQVQGELQVLDEELRRRPPEYAFVCTFNEPMMKLAAIARLHECWRVMTADRTAYTLSVTFNFFASREQPGDELSVAAIYRSAQGPLA